MATTDDIIAAVETAQTEIGASLQTMKTDTGVAIESIELVDAAAEPPVVKINVTLPTEDAPKEEATTDVPTSLQDYFAP
jgi:hypothetical protein